MTVYFTVGVLKDTCCITITKERKTTSVTPSTGGEHKIVYMRKHTGLWIQPYVQLVNHLYSKKIYPNDNAADYVPGANPHQYSYSLLPIRFLGAIKQYIDGALLATKQQTRECAEDSKITLKGTGSVLVTQSNKGTTWCYLAL